MKKSRGISRRNFIGTTSCAAIGYSTLMSSILSLRSINALAASNSTTMAGGDYKALVCLALSGGNDSFNMLMPRTGQPYTDYQTTRSNLAIEAGEMQWINPLQGDGRDYGIHPSMGQLRQLFESQKMAFISNVGTLIAPTSKTEIYNGSAALPLGLFSHSDQYQQWQTGLPHERSAKGWGGKMADLLHDMNGNQNVSMNISLSGTNLFQTGEEVVQYAIDRNEGGVGIYGYGTTDMYDYFNIERTRAIDNMMEATYADLYKRTYMDVIRTSQRATEEFNEALAGSPDFNDVFSDNEISERFRMIARTIAAHDTLNVKRQTFFVDFGGWDHHDEVLDNQAGMLYIVDQAIQEFQNAMVMIDCEDMVTTFSLSEFSRTLTSNGNGTDHAWGANVMVAGGSVNGQRIYGDFPSLALNSEYEIGNGVLIPTTSTDQYFAELALWFGVAPSDLSLLFPNIGNFYDVSSGQMPLGFLNV